MADGPVTITVAYPVAPGDEEDFDAWSRLRLAESAERPGYLGGEVMAPARPGPDWIIVHRLEDERAARRWEEWFVESPGADPASSLTWSIEEPPAPAPDPPTQPALSPPPPPREPRAASRAVREPPARQELRQDTPRGLREHAPRRSRPDDVRDGRDVRQDTPRGGSRRDVREDVPRGLLRDPRGETRVDLRPELPRELREGGRPERRPEPPGEPRDGRPGRGPEASPDLREVGRTEPPASTAFTVLVTLVAVFLSAALFDAVMLPVLQGQPALVRTAVLAVVVTGAVTAVLTPSSRRRVRNWLVPIAIRERWDLSEDPLPSRGRRGRRGRARRGASRSREPYT